MPLPALEIVLELKYLATNYGLAPGHRRGFPPVDSAFPTVQDVHILVAVQQEMH